MIFWTNLDCDPICAIERRGGEKKLELVRLVRAAEKNEEDKGENFFYLYCLAWVKPALNFFLSARA